MTPRMRRLASDYEQVKKDFTGHKNIMVTPVGDEPPEKYHVTYFVNGIHLLPDGKIETLGKHEVDITLHSDYPRYKPICTIQTPIWHPNFRDGQICIGDIWGAGESLSDIIVNIGDMIQYKSWNSFSPLSAEAAQWAIENKSLFPVGNIDLYVADYTAATQAVEIDLFGDENAEKAEAAEEKPAVEDATTAKEEEITDGNDFNITAEELEGIEFVPTAQRMQTSAHGSTVKGGKMNFKTVLVKGLIWAIIGAILGFGVSEITEKNITSDVSAAILSGHSEFADYYRYSTKADAAWDKVYAEFKDYCRDNGYDYNDTNVFALWLDSGISEEAKAHLEDYNEYNTLSEEEIYDVCSNEYNMDYEKMGKAGAAVTRMGTALWSAVIALFIGLFLGIGEGVYYGAKGKTVMYALIGAGISLAIGFASGYLAQWMYAELLGDNTSDFFAALLRGFGWAIMGLGVGVAIGLIKPEKKRILFCSLGGLVGSFNGGFLFNYIFEIIPNDVVARGAAIVLMGILIGVGVGLLEQFAKSAWLKVIRGEFEGKEYLVFSGTTSIGNNGKNTIVLFKDKLIGPHHCDIILEGNKYVLVDCGTPMGTIVNGRKIQRHILRNGDSIAIGNSVLVFNTK